MNRPHLNHIRIGVWEHYQPLICWWGLIIYGLISMMLKIVWIVRLLLCLRICWRSLLVLVIWKYKCLAICMEAVWRGWLGKSSVLLLCRKLAIGIVSPYLRKCHNHSSWKAYSQLMDPYVPRRQEHLISFRCSNPCKIHQRKLKLAIRQNNNLKCRLYSRQYISIRISAKFVRLLIFKN